MHTEEAKQRIRLACIGRRPSVECYMKGAISRTGKHLSEEHKRKISESSIGKVVTEKTRNKLSISNTGKHHSEETKLKMGLQRKGRRLSDETKEKLRKSSTGRVFSEERRARISSALKGKVSKRKGVPGKKHSPETKAKMSISRKGWKPSRENICKCLRRRTISSLEQRVLNCIQKYELPYRFVGKGDFFIERKNPDFVNTNGQKIAVEVYARRHKEQFRGGVEEWKSERSSIFSKYGWTIIYIEDYQTNTEESILNLLGGRNGFQNT